MGRIMGFNIRQTGEEASLEQDSGWCHPAMSPSLGIDEVHVWRAATDLPGSHIQTLHRTLSTDERARAGRFYFEKDSARFIVGRGLLRAILGRYLGIEPDHLEFCYNIHGKPALTEEFGDNVLRFNLSHSHGLILYAIARNRDIGIDLEFIRPELAEERIAERFFSLNEIAALRALPKTMQHRAFFACWTRKEAYIKARGEGLSLPLDEFDVSLSPGKPAVLLNTRSDPLVAFRWSLRDLNPGSGYIGALAVEGHDWQLSCWQWPTAELEHNFLRTR